MPQAPSRKLRRRVYETDLTNLQKEIEAFRKSQHLKVEDEIERRYRPRLAAIELLLQGDTKGSATPSKPEVKKASTSRQRRKEPVSRPPAAIQLPKAAAQILEALGDKVQKFSKKDLFAALKKARKTLTAKSIEHGLYWLKANQLIAWQTPPRGPAPGIYQKGPKPTPNLPKAGSPAK